MKKITLILLTLFTASSFFLTSCFEKASITPPNISLGYNAPSSIQVLSKMSTVGPFSLTASQVYLNIDSILGVNNISITNVQSVILNTIKFEIQNPDSLVSNFNFLNAVTANLSVGSTTQTFMSANPLPKGLASFTVDGNNYDILPLHAQRLFTFTYAGTTNAPILRDVNVKITVGFTITAKPA